MERAGSIGRVSAWPRKNRSFPPEEAGGVFPAPPAEKSAPYDYKRAAQAPGPWIPSDLTPHLFSKG
ncbi:MAG: hypothetical protein FJ117_17530 [Deltaproteobacteria bacterium]|nr:hypothetical protein [Deltaproteobacteria bacterium]